MLDGFSFPARMNCKNCGRANPQGSLYCQDCGHRLGDWVPAERPNALPTPPTGIDRGPRAPVVAAPAASAPLPASPPPQAATPMITCPRCSTPNPSHMRFCNNCGFQLGGVQAAPAPVAQVAPVPQPARPPASPFGAQPAPVCWRCRSIGEVGADFCKFCGARYADGAQPAPAAPAPDLGAQAYGAAPYGVGAQAAVAQPVAGQGFGSPAASSVGSAIASYGARHAEAAPPPPAPSPEPSRTFGTLVAILKDGSDGRAYPIVDDPTDLGRVEGHVVLGDDPYLSPRHARLVPKPDGLLIRDLDSINGIYVRIREPVELNDGDMLLLGQLLLRFEVLPETELPLGPAMHRGVLVFGTPEVPRLARLVQYTTEGVGRDVHYLYRDETVVGREQGDVVCTDDPFMSRRHAAIALDRSARRFVLRDLGSSNGTAIRIRGERLLKPGNQFRVGRHLFRYDRPGAST
jgi:pSer/pThr/pTyr-binding forkhead associated (FHA) protein/ribosomal protein L34E